MVYIQQSHGSTAKESRDYVWEEEGELKQIMVLYTGKFLASYNAQEICSQRHKWRAEGKVASTASSSVGPQGYRKNIPKMQECRGAYFS